MPICKHFWPQHAHFAHGRSRITCMYMLSVFAIARDGVQSEYCRTHVPHLSGPVVLVETKIWSPEEMYTTPLLISKFRSVMNDDPES